MNSLIVSNTEGDSLLEHCEIEGPASLFEIGVSLFPPSYHLPCHYSSTKREVYRGDSLTTNTRFLVRITTVERSNLIFINFLKFKIHEDNYGIDLFRPLEKNVL